MKDHFNQKDYWERERKRRPPNHPVIAAFVTPKVKFISKYITFSEETRVLDVGCGNGFFTYYLSELAYTVGIDYSKYMLSINPCDPLVQGSALLLPFKENSFDLVFCSNLLHHTNDPISVVKEMRRVSKEFVVLSEPNRTNPLMALFSAIISEERRALRYSSKYIEGLVELCGLKIADSSSMGSIVPNKTPTPLLAVFKKLDSKNTWGLYNLVIAYKR
jgi:SAM-dependent methyltransferase